MKRLLYAMLISFGVLLGIIIFVNGCFFVFDFLYSFPAWVGDVVLYGIMFLIGTICSYYILRFQ